MLINRHIVYTCVIMYLFLVVEHGETCLIVSGLQATRHQDKGKSACHLNDKEGLWRASSGLDWSSLHSLGIFWPSS